jgi:signal transduction protein with GAF and PtsI domain
MIDNSSIVDSLNDKLATLMEIAALVNSNHSLDVVVQRAVQSACRLTGAETGSLMLLDTINQELYFEIVLGQHKNDLKELRIPKRHGIGGWVVEHNMPMIVPDVQADSRFYRVADETINFVTRSMIAVPLCVKGRVIGVLQSINKQSGEFDHADLKLTVALANLVAPAIDENLNRWMPSTPG